MWCGNPSFRTERNRSKSFADVAPLLRTPGVNFVSLNPGLPREQVTALAELPNVAHLAADFRDFADTAAVIENLDLVVTTDTATAHLAG